MVLRTRTALGLGVAVLAALAACGEDAGSEDPSRSSVFGDAGRSDGGPRPDASLEDGSTGPVVVGASEPVSIAVDCGGPRVSVPSGQRKAVACRAVGTMPSGVKADLSTEALWTIDDATLATISAKGDVTALGLRGGKLRVTASRGSLVANTLIDLDLVVERNSANVSPADLATLRSSNTAATGVTWAYPYDKTVFPRGLPAPEFMWNGGPESSAVYVLLEAANAKLEAVVKRPRAGKALIDGADWHVFEESAEGAVRVTVKGLVGSAAQVLGTQTWTIAPGSLRGTVYYWAANVGRVLRLKPGRAAPEDFTANVPGIPSASCTTTCHTVSANGSTFLSGGDGLGGTFDLRTNRVFKDVGGTPGQPNKRRFAFGGVSADGRFVTESFAPFPLGFGDIAGSGGQGGLFDATTLAKIPNSGLDGVKLGTPSWAADDKMIAFIDYYVGGVAKAEEGALKVMDWDGSVPRASGLRTIMTKGAGQPMHTPSMSPDHKLVAYHRGGLRTDGGNKGDLFLAFTAPGTPGEVRLAAANGDGAALPGGARDLNWNFEPTFAPRAAGGFFWAVFTSRRVYGNELTGAADTVKQLWVTAIDVNAAPGKDPSHPAFRLPGQAGSSLNLRGFWALDPCKANGQSCGDGSECCGGFCESSGDAGALVCSSTPPACSRDGDRCKEPKDCCNAGASCIAGTCSVPPPR